MDERDQTSFEDGYLALKVLLFSGGVLTSLYFINKKMTGLIEKKRARARGEEEVLTEEEQEIKIGGDWVLKDL